MAVSSANNRNDYTGNGAVSTYSYTFKIEEESDLVVVRRTISTGVETTLVLTTDYTVAGEGDDAGGSITLVAGVLASTYSLSIRRVVPLTQLTDIRNQGDFFPETHEDAYDKLTFIDQQQQEQIDRCLKLPASISDDDFDPTIPTAVSLAASAGKVFLVNEDSDGFDMGPTADDIENAQTYANNAAASATAAASSATSAASSATAAAASAAAASASAGRRNSQAMTQGSRTVTVTYSSALSAAANSIQLSFKNTVDAADDLQFFEYVITAESSTGFTAYLSQAPLTGNYTVKYEANIYA